MIDFTDHVRAGLDGINEPLQVKAREAVFNIEWIFHIDILESRAADWLHDFETIYATKPWKYDFVLAREVVYENQVDMTINATSEKKAVKLFSEMIEAMGLRKHVFCWTVEED